MNVTRAAARHPRPVAKMQLFRPAIPGQRPRRSLPEAARYRRVDDAKALTREVMACCAKPACAGARDGGHVRNGLAEPSRSRCDAEIDEAAPDVRERLRAPARAGARRLLADARKLARSNEDKRRSGGKRVCVSTTRRKDRKSLPRDAATHDANASARLALQLGWVFGRRVDDGDAWSVCPLSSRRRSFGSTKSPHIHGSRASHSRSRSVLPRVPKR